MGADGVTPTGLIILIVYIVSRVIALSGFALVYNLVVQVGLLCCVFVA